MNKQNSIFHEAQSFDILAKTLAGLEEILAEEARALGGIDIRIEKRAVRFKASMEVIYRLNYYSRTAIRILVIISEFFARDDTELYNKISAYDWSEVLTIKQSFAVDSVVYSPVFTHSHFVALRVKDAIADQFMKNVSIRPSVDPKNPDIQIHIHISDKRCTLALDSTGASLHKRGYRLEHGLAPLNEVLAAGMIMLSGWDGSTDFMDPMCGSGTLLIEAALIATNIAPGSFRKKFLFQNWKGFDQELFDKVKMFSPPRSDIKVRISGSDSLYPQIRIARKNVENAGLTNYIELVKIPFSEARPQSSRGSLVFNPPYGERIRDKDLIGMYHEIGSVLKHHFNGWTAWVLSSNKQAMKHIGLKYSKKHTLLNGELKCDFQAYDLYSGTRKMMLENKD